jgi:N-sulfoglucosamine sulfohydrolase
MTPRRISFPFLFSFLLLAWLSPAAGASTPSKRPDGRDRRPVASNACSPGAPRAKPGEVPNVLWIVSEDNSPLVGAYGDRVARTPNIDRLAAEGVRFDNAFAASPVCAPSRFGIFLGIHPAAGAGAQDMRHLRQSRLPAGIEGFPAYLRRAGYHTTNNAKTDYNFEDEGRTARAWNASSGSAHFRDRPAGALFFAVFNIGLSHEGTLHRALGAPKTSPKDILLPAHHPDTPELRSDWAHYYDAVARMDTRVGEILDELRAAGLESDTIVFYYGDHGGVLPRSKRFLYDSGLRVPLVIRFPPRWCHLAPAPPGGRTDRLVSLVDLGPTVLRIARVPIPGHMQGRPFLGDGAVKRRAVLVARRRMDEQMDLARGVVDKRYLYIRSFYPYRPVVSHIGYAWQARGYQTIGRLFGEGKLPPVQARWFEPRQSGEELYDLVRDPANVHNLAGDPRHATVLARLRQELARSMAEVGDTAFSPEGIQGGIDYASRTDRTRYPYPLLRELALGASDRAARKLPSFVRALGDRRPMVRYWGAVGCAALGEGAKPARAALERRLEDEDPIVRVAAAEALVAQGATEQARRVLESALTEPREELHRLYASQTYLDLGARIDTPRAVFEAALASSRASADRAGEYTVRRLEYLLSDDRPRR